MGKIILKRRKEVIKQNICDPDMSGLRANPQVKNNSRFRVPRTLISDWHNNLLEDKPFVNYTFDLLHDWNDQFKEDYVPFRFRGQQTPIDWKSKIGNSDASYNMKTGHVVDIKKGDMVVREDGEVFLVNWEIQEHANNKATQIAKCNLDMTVVRHVDEKLDKDAYLIEEAHDEVIVETLPCIVAEYAGRPEYTAYAGTPGVTPDHLITVSMQWNDQTKQIEIGDEFKDGRYLYRVVNVSVDEVHRSRRSGVLKIYAKRVAGGREPNVAR